MSVANYCIITSNDGIESNITWNKHPSWLSVVGWLLFGRLTQHTHMYNTKTIMSTSDRRCMSFTDHKTRLGRIDSATRALPADIYCFYIDTDKSRVRARRHRRHVSCGSTFSVVCVCWMCRAALRHEMTKLIILLLKTYMTCMYMGLAWHCMNSTWNSRKYVFIKFCWFEVMITRLQKQLKVILDG